jgi:hypothetical protein
LKAITIEDLKTKFVVSKVAPYGEVIMVPGADFDPDWEALLEEEGFGCVFTEMNSEKFTLVRLEKEEGEEESTAEPESGAGKFLTNWSNADQERLLKRIEESPGTIKEKVIQLLPEFPGRTATGLLKKYQKLKRKSKSRQRVGRPKKQVPDEKVESAPKGDLEDTPKAERVAAAGAQLDVVKTLADLEDCVGELLNMAKIDHDIISRLNCAILLQAMETMERQGKLTIPPTLREHYLNALLQTWDKKVVETFNAKCRALMEASS